MDTNHHIPVVIGVILLILGKCRMQELDKEVEVAAAKLFCTKVDKFESFFKLKQDFESVVSQNELLTEKFQTATKTCISVKKYGDGVEHSVNDNNSNDIVAGLMAVQTYINCKFLTIMTKLIETVELLMERLIKTITENKRANKKKLDGVNNTPFSIIVGHLTLFRDVLNGMYFVLNKFETQYIQPDDQSYVSEAVQMMHLYINKNNVPPTQEEADVDTKIRRIRYIHLQVQELSHRYEVVNCKQTKYNPYEGYFQHTADPIEKLKLKMIENEEVDKMFVDKCVTLVINQAGEMVPKYQWVINTTDLSQYDSIKCMWYGVKKSANEIGDDVKSDFRPSSVFKYNNLTVDILFAQFFSYLQSYMNVYLGWFTTQTQPENMKTVYGKPENMKTVYDNPENVMKKLKLWINVMFKNLPDGDPSLSDIHARLHAPNQVSTETMTIQALHLVIGTRLSIYTDKIELNIVQMDVYQNSGNDFIGKLKEIEVAIEQVLGFVENNANQVNELNLNNL